VNEERAIASSVIGIVLRAWGSLALSASRSSNAEATATTAGERPNRPRSRCAGFSKARVVERLIHVE
jgi:hypothetical protein